MSSQLTAVRFAVNNDTWEYVPNSLVLTTGQGEQSFRSMITGARRTKAVFNDNLEARIGKIEIEVPPTIDMIRKIRLTKERRDDNSVMIEASLNGQRFTATITNAAITNDPPINIGTEGSVALVIEGDPVI